MDKSKKVGIFFKIENEFLVDSVSVDYGEPYGESITYGGHYEYHDRLVPSRPLERRFKLRGYDYYPRGRVVFNTMTNMFRLYVDTCLTSDDINCLIFLFGLEGQKVEIAGDEHYRCARCNKNYVDFCDE
ncbi:MAG: hypothetical protein VB050_10480 [Geobacteraceae bacterium]|nr:hypothetical protein [Geobacteraceae bacterium]